MKKNRSLFLLGCMLSLLFSSCRILNPSIMLRTDILYQYDIPPDSVSPEYRIAPGDQITFQLFANDGFRLIDMTNLGGQQGGGQNAMFFQNANVFRYLVEYDGQVKLPSVGRTKLAGLTIREAELFLQKEYSAFYNSPFCLINVLNRRVLVFPGSDGQGISVSLVNENITLMEVLALAGGVTNTGKAHKIKLVRGNPSGNPEVYLLDLSTIEGLADARIVMQANDIVYVEPRLNIAGDLLRELAPIVSLISSTLIVITAINSFSGN